MKGTFRNHILTALVSGAALLLAAAAQAASTPLQEPQAMTQNTRDLAAITETIENISRGADLHQWDSVRASFAGKVLLDYGSPETLSPTDIIARWQPLLEAFDVTQHAVSDVQIKVEGDRASVRSAFIATHVLRGVAGGEVWTLPGRYTHELQRGVEGWKVTAMRMEPGTATGNTALFAEAQRRATSGEVRNANRKLVSNFFSRLEAFDIPGFVAQFAEDGRQLMPFSPPGFPQQLEGRAAILNQYRGLPENFSTMRFPDLVIHDLADPAKFFVTYRGEIALKAGGRYDNRYAGLFTIRNGQISEFVEYFDPLVLQKAFGAQLQENFNVR